MVDAGRRCCRCCCRTIDDDANDADATVVAAAAVNDVVYVIIWCCFVFVIVLAVPPIGVATASWHEVGDVAATDLSNHVNRSANIKQPRRVMSNMSLFTGPYALAAIVDAMQSVRLPLVRRFITHPNHTHFALSLRRIKCTTSVIMSHAGMELVNEVFEDAPVRLLNNMYDNFLVFIMTYCIIIFYIDCIRTGYISSKLQFH